MGGNALRVNFELETNVPLSFYNLSINIRECLPSHIIIKIPDLFCLVTGDFPIAGYGTDLLLFSAYDWLMETLCSRFLEQGDKPARDQEMAAATEKFGGKAGVVVHSGVEKDYRKIAAIIGGSRLE